MVARPHAHAGLVEDLGHVVGVHVVEREGEHTTPLGGFGGPVDGEAVAEAIGEPRMVPSMPERMVWPPGRRKDPWAISAMPSKWG